ncbi:MAG: ankyrin repeat domain-containing protein [Betaproteobacteria bacterium]|nr:ankyrin repeat domain-containing protein [Betaproteobacteria bacterium]
MSDFVRGEIFCSATVAQQVDNPHQQSLAVVRAGNLVTSRDLLDNHGANLNLRNRIDESPLMISIKAGKQDIANYLLYRGARVDIASTANVTPLMAAAFNGDLDMVDRLLERGADVHARDRLKKPRWSVPPERAAPRWWRGSQKRGWISMRVTRMI